MRYKLRSYSNLETGLYRSCLLLFFGWSYLVILQVRSVIFNRSYSKYMVSHFKSLVFNTTINQILAGASQLKRRAPYFQSRDLNLTQQGDGISYAYVAGKKGATMTSPIILLQTRASYTEKKVSPNFHPLSEQKRQGSPKEQAL